MRNTRTFRENYFASCPKGLEEILKKEIEELEIRKPIIKSGGVEFSGSYLQALKVIIKSRVASRVFLELTNFTVLRKRDIYQKATNLNWQKVMRLDQTFKINTLFSPEVKKQFRNSLILSQTLKDAIVDQFRKVLFERPNVQTKNPDISFLLRIDEIQNKKFFSASILIDLVGNPLSNRGYRVPGFSAPMRENLAAGLVLNTDWNHLKEAFVDPMCGTGTILIEAALIMGNITPSFIRLRKFVERNSKQWSFLNHNKYMEDLRIQSEFKRFTALTNNQNQQNLKHSKENLIYGHDIDNEAIKTVKESIRNAGFGRYIITLSKDNATTVKPPKGKTGIVICNPPYGERMEKDEEVLKNLYHNYGENLKKNFKKYRAYIFTGKPDLRKNISLQTSKRIKLYNGNIECRLLRYELF